MSNSIARLKSAIAPGGRCDKRVQQVGTSGIGPEHRYRRLGRASADRGEAAAQTWRFGALDARTPAQMRRSIFTTAERQCTIYGSIRLYTPVDAVNLILTKFVRVRLMLSRLDDPHYCLARARAARRLAEVTSSDIAKGSALALANDYLRLAKFALRRRKNDLAICRHPQ